MKHSSTLYVGLDVHKESIPCCLCPMRRTPRCSASVPSGPASPISISLSAAVHSKNAQLVFVYEVSPLPVAAGDELRRARAIEWRLPRGHTMTRVLHGTRIRIALAALIAIGGATGVMLLSGGLSFIRQNHLRRSALS